MLFDNRVGERLSERRGLTRWLNHDAHVVIALALCRILRLRHCDGLIIHLARDQTAGLSCSRRGRLKTSFKPASIGFL